MIHRRIRAARRPHLSSVLLAASLVLVACPCARATGQGTDAASVEALLSTRNDATLALQGYLTVVSLRNRAVTPHAPLPLHQSPPRDRPSDLLLGCWDARALKMTFVAGPGQYVVEYCCAALVPGAQPIAEPPVRSWLPPIGARLDVTDRVEPQAGPGVLAVGRLAEGPNETVLAVLEAAVGRAVVRPMEVSWFADVGSLATGTGEAINGVECILLERATRPGWRREWIAPELGGLALRTETKTWRPSGDLEGGEAAVVVVSEVRAVRRVGPDLWVPTRVESRQYSIPDLDGASPRLMACDIMLLSGVASPDLTQGALIAAPPNGTLVVGLDGSTHLLQAEGPGLERQIRGGAFAIERNDVPDTMAIDARFGLEEGGA